MQLSVMSALMYTLRQLFTNFIYFALTRLSSTLCLPAVVSETCDGEVLQGILADTNLNLIASAFCIESGEKL